MAKVSDPCKMHLVELGPILRMQTEDSSEKPLQQLIESCVKQGSAQLHEQCKSGHFSGFAAARKLASAMEVAGNYAVNLFLETIYHHPCSSEIAPMQVLRQIRSNCNKSLWMQSFFYTLPECNKLLCE